MITPAAYLFLEKDGKFLISCRRNTGYRDGYYQVPAGHIEEGELPSEALIREAKEEIGITLFPDKIQLVHISYRPKHDETSDRVDFFFKADLWDGEVKNMEPQKCEDMKWVSLDELPNNIIPHVRDAMNCMKNNIVFKELGMDFLKRCGYLD
jgi:8-oxo-dGTP pyrophosphatase MutT (NUDIX family)